MLTFKFDWYEGTVYEQAYDDIAFTLGRAISRTFDLLPSRPAKNYHHGASIVVFGRPVVQLSHGGNKGTHFQVTGQDAVQIAPIIRELFSHEVSRADVACDFHSETIYDNMTEELVNFAHERELTIHREGDWDYFKKGRTLYIGSRKSPAYLRWYQKGLKEQSDPFWCRFELEHKPKGAHNRELASKLSEADIFATSSRWAHNLAAQLMDYEAQQIQKDTWTRTDLEKRQASMFNQYGRTLLEIAENAGSPEQFGVTLLAKLEEHNRVKRGGKE